MGAEGRVSSFGILRMLASCKVGFRCAAAGVCVGVCVCVCVRALCVPCVCRVCIQMSWWDAMQRRPTHYNHLLDSLYFKLP